MSVRHAVGFMWDEWNGVPEVRILSNSVGWISPTRVQRREDDVSATSPPVIEKKPPPEEPSERVIELVRKADGSYGPV
jgi:hypothetical protein